MPTSKIAELQGQLDALLNVLDHALDELSEARKSKVHSAISVAAGRVSSITESIDTIANRIYRLETIRACTTE